ncbi:MAG: hydroxymethylbilane synthase [Polyangiaceae bacterium]|nr:hydroxymethylbilane synthase [Polyangiaceae bacterium]
MVVATRRSALALAQTHATIAALGARHPTVTFTELLVTTTGDRIQDRSLAAIGGKGLFIKEIEQALLDGTARLAIHSAKDVPADTAPGLVLAAYPRREDPRDAWISRTGKGFMDLPSGSRVGTSSLRRARQLGAARPDLAIVPLRGNVDTRLGRCERGEVDALVLACAGLDRLGLSGRVVERIDPELCLPAVGQGALALETRADDGEARALVAVLDDPDTATAVAAERGVMRAVEGSCQVPLAAFAERRGETLLLRAFLSDLEARWTRRRAVSVAWPGDAAAAEAVGRALGAELRFG